MHYTSLLERALVINLILYYGCPNEMVRKIEMLKQGLEDAF